MELKPKDLERWEKVGLAAVAIVVGGHIVKYVYNHRGEALGYAYHTDSGNAFVGIFKNLKETAISQFSGSVSENGFELDQHNLPVDDIEAFEQVFSPSTAPQDAEIEIPLK